MCDFSDNIEGITAIVDEVQEEEFIEESNSITNPQHNKQIVSQAWDPKTIKTTKIAPIKNELFNFLKTSSICFNKKTMVPHKRFLTEDFGLFSDGLELLTSDSKIFNEDAIHYL